MQKALFLPLGFLLPREIAPPFSGSCGVTQVLSSICPGTAATEGLWWGPCRARGPSWADPGAMLLPAARPASSPGQLLWIYAASHKGAWIQCAHGPAGLILAIRKMALWPNGCFLLPWDTQPKYHHLVVKLIWQMWRQTGSESHFLLTAVQPWASHFTSPNSLSSLVVQRW